MEDTLSKNTKFHIETLRQLEKMIEEKTQWNSEWPYDDIIDEEDTDFNYVHTEKRTIIWNSQSLRHSALSHLKNYKAYYAPEASHTGDF